MLSPHLFDYARRLTAAGVEVWTTTNATLIGPTEAEAFADAGFHRVSVSIDGATRRRPTSASAATVGSPTSSPAFARSARCGGGAARPGSTSRWWRWRRISTRSRLWSIWPPMPARTAFTSAASTRGTILRSRSWRERKGCTLSEPARSRPLLAEGERRARMHGIEFWLGGLPRNRVLRPNARPRLRRATGLQSPCSEPWSTINVNARGQIRTCCFNDEAMGTLGEGRRLRRDLERSSYRDLRRHHLRLQTPPSCARCVHAGRVKRSPYLPADTGRDLRVEPAPGSSSRRPTARSAMAGRRGRGVAESGLAATRAARARSGADSRTLPHLGGTTHRAVAAAGPLPRRRAGGARRRQRRHRRLALGDRARGAVRLAGKSSACRFAAPGRRVASCGPSGDYGSSRTQPPTAWSRPRLCRSGSSSTGRSHRRPSRSPATNGAVLTWLCGGYGNAWRGFALLDVADLAPGAYAAEIALASHPPRRIRFRRIVVDRPPSQAT